MSLGTTISRLRAEKNLSQGDLADTLGVSRQSVSKWETDASVPELDRLVKLAALFDVTLDELVTGEKPPAPTPAPSPPQRISGQRIAAIVLLCMGSLVLVLLSAMGGPLEGLILASPFLLCAAICFLAKKRIGLWCAWAVYFVAEFYIRWATGLTWQLTLRTLVFTPEENYTRLAIAWGQLIVMLVMFFFTLRSFRTVHWGLCNRRKLFFLAGGWVLWGFLQGSVKLMTELWFTYKGPFFSYAFDFLITFCRTSLFFLFAALLTATVCGLRRPKT